MAQKTGLIDKVNEVALLDAINQRMEPKFRDILCQQLIENHKNDNNQSSSLDSLKGKDGLIFSKKGKKQVSDSEEDIDDQDYSVSAK